VAALEKYGRRQKTPVISPVFRTERRWNENSGGQLCVAGALIRNG
jgi:hypothetical protein